MTHGNLILMHGEDTFSIKERIDLWKNEFIKRYDGDTNINEIDGDSTTVSDIIDAISVKSGRTEETCGKTCRYP